MSRAILEAQRVTWQSKRQLRAIYEDYYRRLVAARAPGITLEVGGGSGNLKGYCGEVISADIVPAPWLDLAADAQALPFADASLGNIVCLDVLHHIERPCRFLAEAQRTLVEGGRLIMLEPAITPISWFFYHFLHPEAMDLGADPLADGTLARGRTPFEANQAIPTLLFGRYRQGVAAHFPCLHLVDLRHLSLFAYPLSGGFRPWSLVPAATVAPLLRLEDGLPAWLARQLGFRLLAIMEKRGPAGGDGNRSGSC